MTEPEDSENSNGSPDASHHYFPGHNDINSYYMVSKTKNVCIVLQQGVS